jgi:uroporphyrinogen III methyltransferase/synthase
MPTLSQVPPSARRGIVYLVGAGPGDPELLTLKARRLLEEAEVVVYDHLVSPKTLAGVRPGSELVFAGKKGGSFGCRQEDIDALLVRLAGAGKVVVRLKGGDPFVFGRGGEEAAALAAAGIRFEIVPGITAALGAAAYAGIPLTHRARSSAVVFLTGHEDPAKPGSPIRWEDYSKLGATLCIYMGVRNLPAIAERLQAGGLPAETPAAIIQEATTGRQRVLTATLGTLPRRARDEEVTSPALVVIGVVVGLAEGLSWFDAGRAPAGGTTIP